MARKLKTEDVEVTVETTEKVEEKAPDATANEVTTPIVEISEPDLEIEPQKTSQKIVKIRMRQDHRCTIAGELYNLKEGCCYNVPMSVKLILNKAGVLAPL